MYLAAVLASGTGDGLFYCEREKGRYIGPMERQSGHEHHWADLCKSLHDDRFWKNITCQCHGD